MSVSRPFKWSCNICGKVTEKQGYGLPRKWEWYDGTVKEPEVKHICDSCCEIRDARITKAEWEAFHADYFTNEVNNRHPDLRVGQHLSNLFHEAHPLVAQSLSGTEVDCFYDDNNINDFWIAIADKVKG